MIVIGFGANLPSRFGSPAATINAAQQALGAHGMLIKRESRIWLTAPVPLSDQPWYHNAVVSVETNLRPRAILGKLHEIEEDFGRQRTVRNAPRLIDLDLVTYHDEVHDDPFMTLPHPRMTTRNFVLLPLRDIVSGNWAHPVTGQTLDEMIAVLPDNQEAIPYNESKAAQP